MRFGIRCSFPRIQSYAQALKAWKTGAIFPGDYNYTSPRGLCSARKKNMTVECVPHTGDIVLLLYDHPVVTWHKDESFTIGEHHSKSVAIFANHCTPYSVIVTSGKHFRVTVDGRTYRAEGAITFRPHENTWKVVSEITPWSVPFVNRTRANEALREVGYDEFRCWLKVYVQMAARPVGWTEYLNNDRIISMLRDRKWREMVTHGFQYAWGNPEKALRVIRQAVYAEYECVERKSVPFLG